MEVVRNTKTATERICKNKIKLMKPDLDKKSGFVILSFVSNDAGAKYFGFSCYLQSNKLAFAQPIKNAEFCRKFGILVLKHF